MKPINRNNLKQELEKAICKNHTGKMEGFQSLSTAMTCNKHCQSRAAMDAVKGVKTEKHTR